MDRLRAYWEILGGNVCSQTECRKQLVPPRGNQISTVEDRPPGAAKPAPGAMGSRGTGSLDGTMAPFYGQKSALRDCNRPMLQLSRHWRAGALVGSIVLRFRRAAHRLQRKCELPGNHPEGFASWRSALENA